MEDQLFDKKFIALIPISLVLILAVLYNAYYKAYFERTIHVTKDSSVTVTVVKPSLLYTLADSLQPLSLRDSVYNEGSRQVAGVNLDDRLINAKTVSERYSGRMVYVFLASVNVFTCFCIFFVMLYIQFVRSSSLRQFWIRSGIITGIATLIGVILYCFTGSSLFLVGEVLTYSIELSNKDFNLTTITDSGKLNNSLTYAVALAIILTITFYIWPKRMRKVDFEDQLKETDQQIRLLRVSLYCATTLLVVNMLRLSTIFSWSYAYIPHVHEKITTAAQEFGKSLVSIHGAFHTLVLAAFYLPTAYILDEKRRRVILSSHFTERKKKALLKEQENPSFFSSTLPRVLAVLGPFLTGPLADLLKALFDPINPKP